MAVLQDIADIVHQSANIVAAAAEYKLSDKCRQMESGLSKAVLGLGFLKILFLLTAAGVGLVLWGLYSLLVLKVSAPAAAMILGGAVLVIGLIVCLVTVQTASKDR